MHMNSSMMLLLLVPRLFPSALVHIQRRRPLLLAVIGRHLHLPHGVAGTLLQVVIICQQLGACRAHQNEPVPDLIADDTTLQSK